MNIVQYVENFGGVTNYDVLGHIHGNLGVSGKISGTAQIAYLKKLDRLIKERDATLDRYEQDIKEGKIVRPSNLTLEEIALGHPDLESTQAAIRLLAKKEARRSHV